VGCQASTPFAIEASPSLSFKQHQDRDDTRPLREGGGSRVNETGEQEQVTTLTAHNSLGGGSSTSQCETDETRSFRGYAECAYDQKAAERLWEESLNMVVEAVNWVCLHPIRLEDRESEF
jgi:hypothetical protein